MFNNGDSEVAIFLPQLKKFNGIEMLKNSIIPSGVSINYAITLFRYLKYISKRPRVEKLKTHGLFSCHSWKGAVALKN